MPRRGRKKSTFTCRKPKLHFTESPVQVEPHPVSPVLGADNPVTAKCVPLEDYSDVSWISPNFKEIKNKFQLGEGCRNLRVRKTCNMISRCNLRPRRQCSKQDNNSTAGKRTQNSRGKFKPLTFLHDTNKEEEQESELHSISVDNSPEPEKRMVQGNQSFRNNSADFSTPDNRLIQGKENVNGDSFDTPIVNKKQTSTLTSEFSITEQQDILEQYPRLGNSPKTLSHLNHFDITLQNCSADNISCLYKSPKTKKDNSETQKQTPCPVHEVLNNSRHLPKTSSKNHQCSGIFNSFSHNLNDSCSDAYESPNSENLRRSQRLKEKYLEAVKLFQCPSPKDRGKHLKVLVEDTPESEYHLRLKRRQLRQLVMQL